ncbi:MAG: DUF1292 domain-containing protein [Bacilli bacterium]|nr:DUF1292 domain-containing protein [Bacilli bacterium]
MDDKKMIEIINSEGIKNQVELVTFLNSEDDTRQYIVYTKGETQGVNKDIIIYISRIINDDGIIRIQEIEEDTEWVDVQHLLKKIANKID